MTKLNFGEVLYKYEISKTKQKSLNVTKKKRRLKKKVK